MTGVGAEPAAAGAVAPARPTGRALRALPWLAPVACVVLAVASLPVPALLGFDPWVWLIWGRELNGGLPTTDGSLAWKPLPVLATAPLALFGDAAPALFLVVSRAAGLFGVLLVWRLAARLTGPGTGALAGAVAAAAFLLTPDGEARWIRHLLQGNIEPVTVMLCLLAVHRHLDDRRDQALLLAGAAALTRPEVWPLLALYATVLLWREPRRWWRQVTVVLAAVPLLWFGGDLLVSGDPWAGATAARVLAVTTAQRLAVAGHAIAAAVLPPVWVAAAAGTVWAAHRRRGVPVVLAAGALVWMLEVVVMAGAFGYAALGRFLAPVAAVLCVLAGVAVGRAAGAVRPAGLRLAAVLAVVAACVPFAEPRAAWLPAQLGAARERAAVEADLDRLLDRVGRDVVLSCAPVVIDTAAPAVELRPALAWKLGLPIDGVAHVLAPGRAVVFAQRAGPWDLALTGAPPPGMRPLARGERWALYGQYCPAPAR